MTELADKTFQMRLHQYYITGRRLPSSENPNPTIYRMKIFARDSVVAKSRFWFFMKRLNKIKKANGEVLDVQIIEPEKSETAKTYGIWLRYDSRTSTHNFYKEYRDISKEGAVSQMYQDMAGKHRAASCTIQILKIKSLTPEEVRRPISIQTLGMNFKFPHLHRRPMCPKSVRRDFVTSRTRAFYH